MARTEKPADNPVTPAAESRPAARKKWLLISAALTLALAGSAGAWWFTQSKAAQPPAETPEPPAPPRFVELEPFTVNLIGERVLQTSVSLQVAKAEDADQLKLYQPVVKSRMLMLLSSKSAEALQAPQGKEALAAEIATVLRKPYLKGLSPPAIDGVFLTSFVIQ